MMARVAKGLILLLLLAGAWILLLWFALPVDLLRRSPLSLIALHALPPLGLWGGWLAWRGWLRRRQAQEEQARAQQAEQERQAARLAAEARHRQSLAQQRFGCDCRAVAIAAAVTEPDGLFPPLPNVCLDADAQAHGGAASVLDRLMPRLQAALRGLYGSAPAAAVFPHYIQPPAEAGGAEAVERVREVRKHILTELSLTLQDAPVVFLPQADSAADAVIALFENTPDLPGAVVLGFDAVDSVSVSDDTGAAATTEEVPAGEAVVALLLTHRDFPSMAQAVLSSARQPADSLTPFWARALVPGGSLAPLAQLSPDLVEALAELPVLARIHRAAVGELACGPRVLPLTRSLQPLIERAQLHAGLIEPPFVAEGEAPASPSAQTAAEPRCAWLVHNAGDIDTAGLRLAALGSALAHFDIDLNPIDMATNVTSRLGEPGRATPLALLALASAHTAACAEPVLCSEFRDGHVSLFFAMPAPALEEAA